MPSDLRREWRRTAKGMVASVCYPPASMFLPKAQPFIVSYHRVVEDFEESARTSLPAMLVGKAMFERQLDWLASHFRITTLDEIAAQLDRGDPITQPLAAITFDDGYGDVYDHACPILLRKGLPATFFVVTDLVNRREWQVFDRLYHLLQRAFVRWTDPEAELRRLFDRAGISGVDPALAKAGAEAAATALPPRAPQAEVIRLMDNLESMLGDTTARIPLPLTWDQVLAMRRKGFTIGSHTRTHVWLAREDSRRIADELLNSRLELEQRLGEPVIHFAYPGGQFLSRVAQSVADAGYRFAYTICRHRDPAHPLLTIPRAVLWEHSASDGVGRFAPAVMGCHVHSVFTSMARCGQIHT
jgi:peptidoglycan/xylan/chitin deacetylase (PgdA/CDA1 family)